MWLCALFCLVLGEGEGGVEVDPKDPVGFRGADGGDGGVVRVNGDEVVCRRDAMRVRLARERALPRRQRTPVM
jgi:hypothetical protein